MPQRTSTYFNICIYVMTDFCKQALFKKITIYMYTSSINNFDRKQIVFSFAKFLNGAKNVKRVVFLYLETLACPKHTKF